MQTQQISGVAGGGMLYASRTASAKTSGTGFEQLMQLSQNTETAAEQAKTSVQTKKQNASANVKEEQSVEKSEGEANRPDTSATAEKKAESGRTEDIKEATDVEAAERVAGILVQITEVVKDVLDVTQEQLESFMEELGVTELDLLTPETLQNLTLAANSEQDAVILLTDADLLATVNQLLDAVEQILQEAGITSEALMSSVESPEFESVVSKTLEKMESENSEETVPADVEASSAVSADETEKSVTADKTKEKDTDSSANYDAEPSADVEQFADQLVRHLQKSVEEMGELNNSEDKVSFIREIADQILERVKVSVTAETTSLEIVLTPEELGRVNLTVSAESDGTLKAKFITENDLAKEAIEKNLVQFKEMLQEQGLQVDTIEVAVGNFEFNKNGQTGENEQEEKKNSSRRFLSDEEIGQKEEADQIGRIFLEGGESTVNYMA